jgi:hypothetical protein
VYALKLARQEAERIGGPLTKRSFLVTDNGPSFIARRFADFVREPYSHLRIQYRTPQQLGLLEGFHQTLKMEEVYWRLYEKTQHTSECLGEFHVRYNAVRPHWALVPEEGGDPLVPAEVYAGNRSVHIPRWQDWARAASARLEMLLEGVAEVPILAEVSPASCRRAGAAHRRPLHPRLASLCSLKILFRVGREILSQNGTGKFHLNPVPRQRPTSDAILAEGAKGSVPCQSMPRKR